MTLTRAASAQDLGAVADLERELFGAAAWSRQMVEAEFAALGDNRWIVVAVDRRVVVGYAILLAAGDVADVQRIAVARSHQRAGVGTQLLELLLELAGDTGVLRVLLEVAADNSPALALYGSHGFVEIDRRPRYYPDDVDAVVLQRPVEPIR